MGNLDSKVVLVSGASGGLGEGVSRVLLAHGARVAGIARKWEAGRMPQGAFLPVEADLMRDDAAETAVRQVLEAHGRLDAAIHLMGGFAMDGPLHQAKVETWDSMMAMNARSAFLFFRAALAPMLQRNQGRLVAVGSRSGQQPSAGMGAYAASKAALHMLVLTTAAELKQTGVTVNAVLPSTIDTPANRAAMPDADASRWVSPESIGETIGWLISDAAADVQGALIPVFGKA
jgi:NAD(P)-dependent dehydrogenase (short-subunit alcohol dehydrogenase family)